MNQNKTPEPSRHRTRATGQAVEKKRRGLFLIMDIFLLIGIVGIIFLLILAFTPLSLFGNNAESRQIVYTVEFAGVDQGFVSSFREGDAVVDDATGSKMGEIVQVKIREYEAYTAKLRRYMSERSKILPRRTTGVCAMHQRELTEAIKRSRQIALLPYVTD